MRRNALVCTVTTTSLDLSALMRERDAEPAYDRMACGCAWWSGKGGTSRWEHTAACGPWPASYRSKAKYRGRT